MAEREQWRELDEQATPGPWWAHDGGVSDLDSEVWPVASIESPRNRADRLFIAAARTGWPAAKAEVEQLRALLREAREYIADEWSENCTIVHRIDALLNGLSDG